METNKPINTIRLASRLMGTYKIQSNTKTLLSKGLAITASNDLADYLADNSIFIDPCDNEHGRSVLFAKDKVNIEIVSEKDGIINGQGSVWLNSDEFLKRPGLIRLVNCKNVKIKNLIIVDSPCWAIELHDCEDVEIDNVHVVSKWSYNNDGIILDCCRNVSIKNCTFDTGDDCIAIKTTKRIQSKNIEIANCEFSSAISAFKIGTESVGDVCGVTVKNCVVNKAEICALKIVPTDGGSVRNVRFENLILKSVTGPIFIANGERNNVYFSGEKSDKNSAVENVEFLGITATAKNRAGGANGRVRACVFVSGTKKSRIRNVSFKNCEFTMPGGETTKNDYSVDEMKSQYPEYYVLGMAPAYGGYFRHVDGVLLDNVRFILEKEDCRKEVVKNDVTEYRRID